MMESLVVACVLNLLVVGSFGHDGHPMENPGLFEGDMLIPDTEDRGAVPKDSMLWPEGKIPYVLDKEMEESKTVLQLAIDEYHERTCIRFVPRTTERQYIRIWRGSGCYSHVGRVLGPQVVSLGYGCLFKGIVLHELGHAIGFYHEHSRSDRDEYITIFWDNVNPEFKTQFTKLKPEANRLINDFDYNSVMLYGETVFAKDRKKKTMVAKQEGVTLEDVSDKRHLSDSDVFRIKTLYKC